jgi:hypothetical protein
MLTDADGWCTTQAFDCLGEDFNYASLILAVAGLALLSGTQFTCVTIYQYKSTNTDT